MDEDKSRSQTPSAPGQSSTSNTPQLEGTSTSLSGNSGTPAQSHPTPASSSAAQAANSVPHAVSTQNAKRRRGLGIVTPNACTECRKKRAKCDGQQPCSRCRGQKEIECKYEIPVRQSKENLRTEIESLRSRQKSSDSVLAALVRPGLWEDVLSRLRNGQTVEAIGEWLSDHAPFGAAPQSATSHREQSRMGTTLPPLSNYIGPIPGSLAALNLGLPGIAGAPGTQPSPGLQNNNGSWNFLQRNHSDSNRSDSHTDPMNWLSDKVHVGSGQRETDRSTRLPRCRGLEHILSPLDEPEMQSPSGTWTSITSDINLVQHLLALYFCWEYPTFASLSKEHFLRDFQAGRYRYCSPMLVNALLALGCRFSSQPMTRANPNDPYTSGDHFFKESQRLFYQETNHHALTTIQALGIMSIREASCGRDSESWYYAGQSIRLAIEMGLHRVHDEGDEDELAVQSATFWGAFALDHMYYHFAILLLFRPLIKMRIIGSKVSPRDVCCQAADAIQGLLRSYSQLYTLRRTPSFVPYFVLTSAIMHLAVGATTVSNRSNASDEVSKMAEAAKLDSRVAEALKQGISDLAEMAPCHHFAEQALNILRYLAKKWKIDVDVDDGKTPPEDYHNLVKTYTNTLNFFAPNVVDTDFDCDFGLFQGCAVASATQVEGKVAKYSGDKMDNPLFWPFPLQGRPILARGTELEQAGFELL
ncbi:putative nitrate assimilation regulatory protein nirA [Emericellopsis cladophorae]|uniref:Nitrate assimilation regulatory protein nirA n=1 Tax=Emericellopsis cladophorae TaxID=2686198 RepID=A0A9P9XZH7_9HYPO|nr:putative nitrate assimilation regulatory protein nirA [Emericellopsis cladophorae]KAI6780511.1 putative nitrate assimilation regulatory protein nirA [Emericellopsis cladophorae]